MFEILKTIIYGFISGVTQIVPVSSRGHQAILMQLFGMSHRDPILDFLVHIGILGGIIFCCRSELAQFVHSLSYRGRRRKNSPVAFENRLLKTALIPLLIGMLFYAVGTKFETQPLMLALFFAINGVVLFIPDHIRQSNKNAGQLGFIDSLLIGISGVFACFPGISRIATGMCISLLRGAEKENAFNWVLVLTVPTILFLLVLDLISVFTVGLTALSFWLFIGYILSISAAFAGGYIAIKLMRFLLVNSGLSGFAYYSWGAAAFTFILYLIAY